MNTLETITLFAALFLSFVLPWGFWVAGERSRGRYQRSLAVNVISFFGLMLIAAVLMFTGDFRAFADTAETVASDGGLATGLAYISAAAVTGMSCLGGGFAVANAASAALGALSEDSSILGKSLIFVGLAEGVCLYGLIISFMILGKV